MRIFVTITTDLLSMLLSHYANGGIIKMSLHPNSTLYSWEVFIAVTENKSIAKAARALNLSQSAVSHMIKKLENEQGYPLLIRDRNSIELSQNGKILLPYIRNLLQCSNSLNQEIMSLKDSNSGIVRLAAFNSATATWIPNILSSFKQLYPNIRVIIMQSGDLSIRKWIDNGEVDLAFAAAGTVDNKLLFPLHKTPLICMTPKNYIPLNGHSITVEDLKNNPVILQSEGYDTEPIKFLLDNGISTESNFRIETDDTCHAMVEFGFGFCITPKMAICNPRNVNIYPLLPTFYRTVGLVTVYPEYMSPAAKLLRQHIFKFIEESGLMNI
jgi:DNA-binding transcriptional LysR family regulator